jgi:SET and MYND domain-containing protein
MGNGLFATANMEPGDTVLHIEAPFVAVLDSPRLEDTCGGCFGKRQVETGSELKACTGCRVVKYCDRVSRIILQGYLDLSIPVLLQIFYFVPMFDSNC